MRNNLSCGNGATKTMEDEDSNTAESSGQPEDPEVETEAKANEKPERSLADKVEESIRTFLDFIRSYVHTLVFALSPRRLSNYDGGVHTNDKLLIRPLTFLCCSFIPYAAILDLSSGTVWAFLLSPETAASRMIERIQSASPLKIVLGSIPALIAIYLGASLLSRIAVQDRENRGTFINGICYAFAIQFCATPVIMLLMILGHTRISEKILPSVVVNTAVDALVYSGAFYCILLGALVYPFIVSIRIVRRFAKPRGLARSTLTVTGVLIITAFTYWIGILPSRFRAAMTEEKKVTMERTDGKLRFVSGAPPAIDLSFIITNPTKDLFMFRADEGLTVRLKLSSDSSVIPRNAFSVQVLQPQNVPLLVVPPNDAIWVDGRIAPDFRDWQLLESNRDRGGSIAVWAEVSNLQGNRVVQGWQDFVVEGNWPILPTMEIPPSRNNK